MRSFDSSESLKPGIVVKVRLRRYLVEEVIPPQAGDDSTLVRLSCMDDDAQGEPLEVLWEKEIDAEIVSEESWRDVAGRGFDPPEMFSAYLHTLRWNCATATDPELFQSPFRAGIRIDAYQLEPLRKALTLPRVNLFIADDVGLGKTIEAGLIARELLMRKKINEIVVACPPSMIEQWSGELENRFGMIFQVMDREYISEIRRGRGYGVNPWTTNSRYLVSHRLLIDESYTASLRDWLGSFKPGSLLILDEAHHAAPASGNKYAIDSKFTRAVRDIAGRFEHRLFLSATPHNGHSYSFSALLEILDPQRFCRGVEIGGKNLLDEVMVRRLKDDLRQISGGFPERIVKQIDLGPELVPNDAPELVLSELLDQYRDLREKRMSNESSRQQAAAALLVSGLQQRLLSSIEAFARTLRVHRKTVQKQIEESLKFESSSRNRGENASIESIESFSFGIDADDDRARLDPEEISAEEEKQIETATRVTSPPNSEPRERYRREIELLDRMTEIAEKERSRPDHRIKWIFKWINENMCHGLCEMDSPTRSSRPAWNDKRLIIFTQYEDTLNYLKRKLLERIAETDRGEDRIAIYRGSTSKEERVEIQRAFNADPRKNPTRILIATDAAREGLNLQSRCADLIHFDVPWNPARMEQRNGRIDRKLQPQKKVRCYYFVYTDRFEDRILEVLVKKTEKIKKELGSLSQVIEGRLAQSIASKGIRRSEVESLAEQINRIDQEIRNKVVVEAELEQTRLRIEDIKKRNIELENLLQRSRDSIALDEDHFRSAISSALRLMKADPLVRVQNPIKVEENQLPRFEFPSLDQRERGDAKWADTLDALRTPRKRDQKLWEWRSQNPVRPVVFEDPGTMDEDVVHLHLEHRVVKRLLARFSSQGFVHHDLSRACLAHAHDSVPRVVLLGRLCLYGSGAARLHEEIVPVTARWIDPSIRDQKREKLSPYARETESKTLDLLESTLKSGYHATVEPAIQKKLLASAPRDVEELVGALNIRAKEYGNTARGKLIDRSRNESQEMSKILNDQKRRVLSEIEKHGDPQLTLDFNDEEKRQIESNKRHWEKRLEAIDREATEEPDRIRKIYEIKAVRVEPIGLVYLYPKSG